MNSSVPPLHAIPQSQLTPEVLLAHLQYLRQDMDNIVKALPTLATSAHVERIERSLSAYASGNEVRALESRIDGEIKGIRASLDTLRSEVVGQSISSRMSNAATWAQRILAIIGLCGALWVGGTVFVDFVRDNKPATATVAKP